jgi:O-antigen ligase
VIELRAPRGGTVLEVAFAATIAVALGLVFLLLADASLTWQLLIFAALCSAAALFWSRDAEMFLLFMYVTTVSIGMSKALIVEGGIYSPGLSLNLSDLFFFPLAALWAWRRLVVEQRGLRLDSLQRFTLIFLAWLWFTAIISEDVLAGTLAAITYSKYVLMAIIVCEFVSSEARLRVILAGSAVTLAVHLLYAAAQALTGNALDIQGVKPTAVGVNLVFEGAGGVSAFRPSGFFTHPNVLADYLTYVLPCGVAIVAFGRKGLGRAWGLAALLTLGGIVVLVLTLSRGGWIATAAALAVMVVAGARKRLVATRQVFAIVGVLACLLALIAIAYPAAYLRITESDQRSSESRLAMMDQALLIIQRNPVLGVGFGGYNRAAQNNIPESYSLVGTAFREQLLKGVVHNKYLLTTAEHGLIGLALFLTLLWRHLAIFFRQPVWRRGLTGAFALGATGAIAGQCVFFLFDHFYLDVRMEILWLTFGILGGLARVERHAHARMARA